jgi:hypothetical protein
MGGISNVKLSALMKVAARAPKGRGALNDLANPLVPEDLREYMDRKPAPTEPTGPRGQRSKNPKHLHAPADAQYGVNARAENRYVVDPNYMQRDYRSPLAQISHSAMRPGGEYTDFNPVTNSLWSEQEFGGHLPGGLRGRNSEGLPLAQLQAAQERSIPSVYPGSKARVTGLEPRAALTALAKKLRGV